MASGMTLVPVAIAAAAATDALGGGLGGVGQQGQLAGALDGGRDLVLVPAAGARDAARADLAALGHEAPQARDVLVVDELDLVLAVRAGLAAPAAGTALLVSATRRLRCALALLGHGGESLLGCCGKKSGRANARLALTREVQSVTRARGHRSSGAVSQRADGAV